MKHAILALAFLLELAAIACFAACGRSQAAAGQPAGEGAREIELLNVSYDPTREVWREFNEKFAASYEKESGLKVTVKQSHGGSSTQARAVIDGLDADVVTLASFLDTDQISKRALIAPDWITAFPNRSLPYTSTIVFVVRKGNP